MSNVENFLDKGQMWVLFFYIKARKVCQCPFPKTEAIGDILSYTFHRQCDFVLAKSKTKSYVIILACVEPAVSPCTRLDTPVQSLYRSWELSGLTWGWLTMRVRSILRFQHRDRCRETRTPGPMQRDKDMGARVWGAAAPRGTRKGKSAQRQERHEGPFPLNHITAVFSNSLFCFSFLFV